MKEPTLKRAVFLDRDGVINETYFRNGKPRAPQNLEEFRYLPGVIEAVARLKKAGFLLVVVTNQPDVTRGWQTLEMVEAMNEKVRLDLNVDDLKVCYHVTDDNCQCRKPKPGMLLDAAREFEIDLFRSFMIGDRMSDIAAGKAAGCTSILVGRGDPTEQYDNLSPSHQVESLSEAVLWIFQRTNQEL